jgi:broad specificity phosphatase PhoE
MSLTLYLLRHGETLYSQSGNYCGDLDPELTPAGVQMAVAFAESYDSIPWSAVYVSPMKRTIATAKPLCEAVQIEMQLRDGLKEIRYGEWEGQTTEAIQQQYATDYINWLTEPAWNPPTGGETSVQIASRASLVIAEIERTYPNGNVLVVSHKATLRIILCSLMGMDLGRYRDRIDMPACAVSVVKFATYGPMLLKLGDHAYMDDSLRSLPGT